MIENIIEKEQQYQENTINLIASDNYASKDVLMACGSCLQNIYSEGKPNIEPIEQSDKPYFWYKESVYQRYYAGCENVDKIETSLEAHQVRLMKDTAMLDQIYKMNQEYFKQVNFKIAAAKDKLEQRRSGNYPEDCADIIPDITE